MTSLHGFFKQHKEDVQLSFFDYVTGKYRHADTENEGFTRDRENICCKCA